MQGEDNIEELDEEHNANTIDGNSKIDTEFYKNSIDIDNCDDDDDDEIEPQKEIGNNDNRSDPWKDLDFNHKYKEGSQKNNYEDSHEDYDDSLSIIFFYIRYDNKNSRRYQRWDKRLK